MKMWDDAAMHDYVLRRKATIDAQVSDWYQNFISIPLERLLDEDAYDRLHTEIALKLSEDERARLESLSDEELGLDDDKWQDY